MSSNTLKSGNPISALTQRANERPRDIAFWFAGQAWSYEQFASESLALARGMKRLGLKKGDIVAAHMNNRPEMLLTYAACMHIGVIMAPLRTAFKTAELLPLLQRLQSKLYIGEADLYPNVASADPAMLPFETRFVVGNIADGRVGHWSELMDRRDSRDVLTVSDPEAPVVLICTSGTTGEPKLVCHTQATASAIIEAISQIRGSVLGDVALGHLALAHSSGFFSLLSNLRDGVPFVLMTFDADAMLDAIATYRCTFMISFPSHYAAMVERQLARSRDLSTLRLCLTAGDVCPIDLQNTATTVFGREILNIWGATETVGGLTYATQPGPVCRVVEGAEIRLVDDDDNDVPHGAVGEFCLRGPYLFASYWKQPNATAETIRNGWYYSGDLMRRGDGDEIWFVGRRKDIIIRSGTNISPAEIEEALVTAHPAVAQAAVVGIPDHILGQRVVGFVKMEAGAPDCDLSEIRAALSERLASYKVPEWLAVLPDLPLNHLGKLDRKALVAMAQWRDNEERGDRPSMWRRPASA